jgi:hypothetical protein
MNSNKTLVNLLNLQNLNKIEFVPCNLLEFTKDQNITTGYDLTVEDYKTFISEHGIYLYDTNAIYAIHDIKALKEVEQKAFLKNNITYDQNDSFLSTIRHEALFAAFVLTKQDFNKDDIIVDDIETLDELPENIDLWNNSLESAVKFKSGKIFSYGNCLFNKFCGFKKPIITFSITKKQINNISQIIYKYFKQNNEKYYDALTNLEKQLFNFVSSTFHTPSINMEEMIKLKPENVNKILKNLPNNNIKLGCHIVEAFTNKCIDNMDKSSQLYKLYKSGSRFSKSQLARSTIIIGYSADADNIVIPRPIKTSLLEGLTEKQYFAVSPATRKSIKDKSRHTPDSGYLERTLVMALSMIEFDLDDCRTNNCLEFVVMSQKHAKTLVGKFYCDPNDYPPDSWKELDLETAKSYINKKIKIRSPITCTNPNFKICRKCFGSKKLSTNYVGIVSGQLITER